jgi:hypothetical protein
MVSLPVEATLVASSTQSAPAHVHRWRIDEQAGVSSAGRCSCGEERAFQNGWEGDGSSLRGGGWIGHRTREIPNRS